MNYEKLAPGLLAAFEDLRSSGTPAMAAHAVTLGMVMSPDPAKPVRIPVFVTCSNDARLQRLASYGVQVNQGRGKVRTAFLPLDSLDRLSDDAEILHISPSRVLQPRMDLAAPHTGVDSFRNSSGLSGTGVVVGIVDTGIDPLHPAFAGRIHRIWDQKLSGTGVPEGGYGRELSGGMLAVSNDPDGHGTHVAGIAAGSDPTYNGVAPDATLVAVRTDFNNAHIADAIRYIFRVARDLNLPAVVNLSLGGHFDAHDGSDDLCAIINAEVGPGKIVVSAAGNEGTDDIHGRIVVPPGQTVTMQVAVHAGAISAALINGWYTGSERLEVSAETPGGFTTPPQPVIANGNPFRRHSLPDGRVSLSTPGPSLLNRDHGFEVELRSRQPGQRLAAGTWRLHLSNPGGSDVTVDAWMIDGQSTPEVVFTGASVSDTMKIGSPGSAAEGIAVAAYTTRNQWTDSAGQSWQVSQPLHDIADFSSEGPLRNGAQKPDVTAPGAQICSATSAASNPQSHWRITSEFRLMQGTSMASPFVAGIVALLLERDRTMDPSAVRATLRANSSIPNQAAGAFDIKWGFGLIDATGL